MVRQTSNRGPRPSAPKDRPADQPDAPEVATDAPDVPDAPEASPDSAASDSPADSSDPAAGATENGNATAQTETPRPCRTCDKLPADHAGADHEYKAKRAYVKRSPSVDVPLDILAAVEEVPESEWADTPVVTQDRSDAQKLLDKQVDDLHKQWIEKGKPSAAKSPRNRHVVAPEHAAGLRRMLRRSETLHGIKINFMPKHFGTDGREIVVYTARDKDSPQSPTAVSAPVSGGADDNATAGAEGNQDPSA